MINKNYFKNLCLSNRYLLIFVLLISLLSLFSKDYSVLLFVILDIMTFVLPISVFKNVHDKKAVDTYFALPVSRKEILITSLLFCILGSLLPFAISEFVSVFIYEELSFASFLVYILENLLVSSTLVTFNTMLYLLGNNLFDGIVILGAYSVMPFFVYLMFNIFTEVFICGASTSDFGYFTYFMPSITSGILQLRNNDEFNIIFNNKDFNLVLTLILFLVLSLIVLCKTFPNRKAERAGTSSSGFFAYPFVIYSYTLFCLFGIASNYSLSYTNIFDFLEEFVVLYIITFALFVIAHFIYKRKFYFSIKMPIFFIIAICLTIGFCTLARETKGFGLSNNYQKDDPYVRYEIYNFEANQEIINYVNDKSASKNNNYLSISIKATNKDNLPKEVIDIFENFRIKAINEFYNNDNLANKASMWVYNGYSEENDLIDYDAEYHYYIKDFTIDMNELLLFAENGIRVVFECYDGEYLLLKNGDLLLINLYNYDVAMEG